MLRKNLAKALLELFQESKELTGTIEVIKLYGDKELENECEYWVQYGISNIEEIYQDAQRIIQLIEGCNEIKSISAQFWASIVAVLDDFSYHASIFGIYYFALEDIMKLKQQGTLPPIDKLKEMSHISTNDENISSIASEWNSNLTFTGRLKCLKNLLEASHKIVFSIETLFIKNMIRDISSRYYLLRNLYAAILVVQQIWSIILEDKEMFIYRTKLQK